MSTFVIEYLADGPPPTRYGAAADKRLVRHLGIDTTNPVGGTALQLVKDIAS